VAPALRVTPAADLDLGLDLDLIGFGFDAVM
jgi:hypothetical protein